MPELQVVLVNAIVTPDGTRLESTHVHDYQQHIDAKTGELYFTDGGLSYVRRSLNIVPAKDASVYSDDPHSIVRESFKWGTHGKDGNQPLTRIPLADLELDHIKAILSTQKHLRYEVRQIFVNELAFRARPNHENVISGRLDYPDIV